MHGLNANFVQSAQKLYEKNPTADFTKLFDQYHTHLASFSNLKPAAAVTLFPSLAPVAPAAAPSTPKIPSLPAAPSFSTMPALPSAITPLAPVTKMFTPVKNNTRSDSSDDDDDDDVVMIEKPTFSFPAPTQPAPQLTPVAIEKKQPSVFASPAVPEEKEQKQKEQAAATPSFSFGLIPVPETEKVFVEEKPAVESVSVPVDSVTAAVTKVPEQEPKFSFKSGVLPPPAPSYTPDNSKLFGSEMPKFSFGSYPTSTSTSTTSNSFSFGSSATVTELPLKAPVAASVESCSSSLKSSVSEEPKFSFSTATAATVEAPKFSFGTETPKFSFGSSTLPPLPSFSINQPLLPPTLNTGFSFTAPPAKVAESADEGDEIPADEAESFSLTRSNNDLLKTGAGEENETCQHEERCKIFMMDKSANGWVDLGVGIFKINRYNNEAGKSRILCRAEGSGKIIMNSLISVPGTEVTCLDGKKEVALLTTGPEGKPAKYLVRVKTLEQSQALKSALLSELEHVQNGKN